MKTLKALKITSVVQIIYCLYWLAIPLLLLIGFYTNANACLQIGTYLFFYTVEFVILVPFICFVINLSYFLKESKDAEQKQQMGKKWIWIFVWPIISIIFFFIGCFPFIRVPSF